MTGPILGAAALEGHEVTEVSSGDLLFLEPAPRPDLVVGITTRASGTLGFSASRAPDLLDAYQRLAHQLDFPAIGVAFQVHGSDVREVKSPRAPGAGGRPGGPHVVLAGRVDGLYTDEADLLLTVTAADCVPILAWAEDGPIGVAHAGWRGAAAGILRRLVESLTGGDGAEPSLGVHFGPAICGECYEVDRPVLEAFGRPGDRALLDLRGMLVEQARGLGLGSVTASTHCTACAGQMLHSHRGSGGRAGRMAAFLGRRGEKGL